MVVKIIIGGIFILILFFVLWIVFLYQSYSRHLPKPPFQKRELIPDWYRCQNRDVTLTWIGHSTILMQFHDMFILTDPVFAKRIGIRLGLFKIGPKRFTEPALYPAELPQIDIVLLSHAHLDHLDLQSLGKVVTDRTVIVTAENTSRVLKNIHAGKIVELSAGENMVFENGLSVHSIAVKHWGNRFPWNKNYGWTGFLIEYGGKRILFAGDTAFVDTFNRLKEQFGPIAIACIPIGAYKPDSFQRAHCTPEQAWAMFRDSGASWLIPIHWNTFVLSQEPVDEPMKRLITCAGELVNRIVIRKQGETFVLDSLK
jgi:L-ascorbate metabolism protein UlaG (beta-lactamase superfamily)